mmetsp:Transcript_12193/g.26345  ORF Transcript_12193/g.26345 Transcript_12193/m.26345 type:complete len:268 (-) Transcript_12193:72-875(-)
MGTDDPVTPKPPVTPSPLCTILDLLDEVMDLVGLAVLYNSPRDALRFCQTCRAMRAKFEALRVLAEARRLRWLPEATAKHAISEDGRTMTVVGGRDNVESWVAGSLLPTTGKSAWKIFVCKSVRDDGNGMWIGVCDEKARCSWGLSLYSGRLRRLSRDTEGNVDFCGMPCEGFPNGNYKQVMKAETGQRSSLRSGANGAVIEVLVDHDSGGLSYRVNDSPALEALPLRDGDRWREGQPRGFPKGATLRPYASCYYLGDTMSFMTAFV